MRLVQLLARVAQYVSGIAINRIAGTDIADCLSLGQMATLIAAMLSIAIVRTAPETAISKGPDENHEVRAMP